jgi:hypothetical protein
MAFILLLLFLFFQILEYKESKFVKEKLEMNNAFKNLKKTNESLNRLLFGAKIAKPIYEHWIQQEIQKKVVEVQKRIKSLEIENQNLCQKVNESQKQNVEVQEKIKNLEIENKQKAIIVNDANDEMCLKLENLSLNIKEKKKIIINLNEQLVNSKIQNGVNAERFKNKINKVKIKKKDQLTSMRQKYYGYSQTHIEKANEDEKQINHLKTENAKIKKTAEMNTKDLEKQINHLKTENAEIKKQSGMDITHLKNKNELIKKKAELSTKYFKKQLKQNKKEFEKLLEKENEIIKRLENDKQNLRNDFDKQFSKKLQQMTKANQDLLNQFQCIENNSTFIFHFIRKINF